MRRIELCRYRDGDTQITRDGFALLIGLTVEELDTRWDWASPLPADLTRRAQKRATAAINATGTNATGIALAYWATYGLGANIDYHDGITWAILDDDSTDPI